MSTALPLPRKCLWLLLVWACCFGAAPAGAREVTIRLEQLQASGQLTLGRQLGYLEDTQGVSDIAWASAPQRADAFAPLTSEHPHLGYSRSAHWLRFTVDPGSRDVDLLLELAAPTLDDARLYTPLPGGAYAVQAAGDQQPWAVRPIPHRHLVFRVVAAQGAPATFYLRLASSSLVTAPLTLWQPAQFATASVDSALLLGVFYGVLTALLLYNLFLYASLRDRTYLLYVAYVASFGLSLSVFDGLSFQYLWPNQVVWANRALATCLLATLATGSFFAFAFLGPGNFSNWAARIQRTFAAVSCALMILAATGLLLEPRHLWIAITTLSLCGVPIILWIALSAIANKYEPARYFLLAWSALLLFMTVGALRNLGILPINFFSVYGLHFGLAFDVIALSTALAARIRTLSSEVITSQQRLLDASHQYHDTLERRAAELGEANRELESFSYTVAHDLRTPLRAIDGYANLIQAGPGTALDSQARSDLGEISRNARKMAHLIDGLLDYSRLGRATLASDIVDMESLAEAVAQELNPDGQVTIRIAKLASVRGDALLLRQVWVNLISNAIKFSSHSEAPQVDIACTEDAAEAVFSVRDNGAGFDMQYASKLFGMFQRLHAPSDFEGTGVGLAIVKRVIERHGGRISAVSESGAGACFSFQLPSASSNAPARMPMA